MGGAGRALMSSLVVAARAKHGEGAAVTITHANGSTKVVPASWSTLEKAGEVRGANQSANVRLDRGDEARAIADAAGGGGGGDKALARSLAMGFF